MTNLATFSLSVTLSGVYKPHNDTVGLILSALLESCVDLELDLGSSLNATGTGSAHVCEAIRNPLPRLRHLCLNMGTLCLGFSAKNLQQMNRLFKTRLISTSPFIGLSKASS